MRLSNFASNAFAALIFSRKAGSVSTSPKTIKEDIICVDTQVGLSADSFSDSSSAGAAYFLYSAKKRPSPVVRHAIA